MRSFEDMNEFKNTKARIEVVKRDIHNQKIEEVVRVAKIEGLVQEIAQQAKAELLKFIEGQGRVHTLTEDHDKMFIEDGKIKAIFQTPAAKKTYYKIDNDIHAIEKEVREMHYLDPYTSRPRTLEEKLREFLSNLSATVERTYAEAQQDKQENSPEDTI